MHFVSSPYDYECVYVTGTIADGAPIIPISAQLKYNIDAVCEYIVKKIPIPVRDFTSEPRLIGKRYFKSFYYQYCLYIQLFIIFLITADSAALNLCMDTSVV